MEVGSSEEPLERYVKCTSELALQGTMEKGECFSFIPSWSELPYVVLTFSYLKICVCVRIVWRGENLLHGGEETPGQKG